MNRLAKHLLRILIVVLLGGFLGATLVRLAPGFGVDERELDARLSEGSIQALRKARENERHLWHFYTRFLANLCRGDLGTSRSLGRPVAELLSDRLPVTFRSVGSGLIIAWSLGLALALPAAGLKSSAYEVFSTVLSGVFLCLPAAVLALLFLFIDGPSPLAIGLVVFPRVFRYVRNVLLDARALPHIITAKAKGIGGFRVLWWHILPMAVPQILALAGVSVSLAFGASIPVEVICDSPGIGQLAWQAALGRDLPLLVNLTILVTVITLTANLSSDLAISAFGAEQL
ncbi:MAG TPA: ABC transporter permease [Terriglobia bacterium]|nr:ABC transporter permease [Terriglobia bacterium]